MALELFAHPFSSFCWKVLIALYENDTPFAYRMLGPDHPENGATLAALWPVGKFPVLRDGSRSLVQSAAIIEYLDLCHPGPRRMVPADPYIALQARQLDGVFDDYVMAPMQRIVADFIRPEVERDARGVSEAKAMLDKAYGWAETHLAGREWAAGEFGIADCAAAPALFYADWVHPIPEEHTALRAYRARLLARPSVARAVDEARPYRHFFPSGAPDRD